MSDIPSQTFRRIKAVQSVKVYDTIRYQSLTWTRKLSIKLNLAHVAIEYAMLSSDIRLSCNVTTLTFWTLFGETWHEQLGHSITFIQSEGTGQTDRQTVRRCHLVSGWVCRRRGWEFVWHGATQETRWSGLVDSRSTVNHLHEVQRLRHQWRHFRFSLHPLRSVQYQCRYKVSKQEKCANIYKTLTGTQYIIVES